MNKTVLVSGIGGVVGQGILKNIRNSYSGIRIIGTNTAFTSAGNHLCDKVYEVSQADSNKYLKQISKIIEIENVHLIIPSTDLEAYELSCNKADLQTRVAISSPEVTELSLDKWNSFLKLNQHSIPFAPSFLPSEYGNEFKDVVVKPRSGRGSREINYNPSDISKFDDSYVIQQLLHGPEITTTFYVTKEHKLHGSITFIRELDSGNTSKAEVTFQYDNELNEIIKKFISHFDCIGSVNIQSKVTEDGIIPFEINSRISGTNSLRAQFGFNDVKYTIQEWLMEAQPDPPDVSFGCALRIYRDIIYPGSSLKDISNNQDNFKLT